MSNTQIPFGAVTYLNIPFNTKVIVVHSDGTRNTDLISVNTNQIFQDEAGTLQNGDTALYVLQNDDKVYYQRKLPNGDILITLKIVRIHRATTSFIVGVPPQSDLTGIVKMFETPIQSLNQITATKLWAADVFADVAITSLASNVDNNNSAPNLGSPMFMFRRLLKPMNLNMANGEIAIHAGLRGDNIVRVNGGLLSMRDIRKVNLKEDEFIILVSFRRPFRMIFVGSTEIHDRIKAILNKRIPEELGIQLDEATPSGNRLGTSYLVARLQLSTKAQERISALVKEEIR